MRHASVISFLLLVAISFSKNSFAESLRSVMVYPIPGQGITYEQGEAFVASRKRATVIANIQPLNRKKAWLTLTILNNSRDSLTVLNTQILARNRAGPIEIFTAAKILESEKKRQLWENIGAGLVAGANAWSANQQGSHTERGTLSARVSGNGYNNRIIGTYSATGTDAVARQLAVSEANRASEDFREALTMEQQARQSSLTASLFQSQTIAAGGAYSGRMQFALPAPLRGTPSPIVIEAYIGDERHHFLVFVDGPPTMAQIANVEALRPHLAPDSDASKNSPIPQNEISDPPNNP